MKKFRAHDGKQWHYGNLFKITNPWVEKGYAIRILPDVEPGQKGELCLVGNDRIEVTAINCKAGTEGQFTGLHDRNGVDIYEGDIITSSDYVYIDKGKQNYVGIVEYSEPSFLSLLHCVNPDKRGISDGMPDFFEHDEYEILGNIFDHPDLLERE